jgi:hypothetical protein
VAPRHIGEALSGRAHLVPYSMAITASIFRRARVLASLRPLLPRSLIGLPTWSRLTSLLPRLWGSVWQPSLGSLGLSEPMPLLGGVQQLSSGSLGLSEPMPFPVGRLARPNLWVPEAILLLGPAVTVPLVHVVVFCPRSPQANAAILPPLPDGLAAIHSGRPLASVLAASPPDHLPGAFGGGHSSLSAAACFSPLVLNVTRTSRGTVLPLSAPLCRLHLAPADAGGVSAFVRAPPVGTTFVSGAPDHAPWGSSHVSPGVASPISSRAGSRSSPAALSVVLLNRLPRTQESHNSFDW